MAERDVVDPMCVRLDLLAERGWGRLEVGRRLKSAVQIETQVPGAYDAVAAAGISISWSAPRILRTDNKREHAQGKNVQYRVVGVNGETINA